MLLIEKIKTMKKKSLFIFTTLLLSFTSWGQNLVPNPSFEEYDECPNYFYENVFLTAWKININTADYFNHCSSSEYVSIPSNAMGHQSCPDLSCGGYIGLITYVNIFDNKREYVGTDLIENLIVGQRYYISYKVSLADNSMCAVNNIGILFTNMVFNEINISEPFLSIDPTFILRNSAHVYSEEIVSDKEKWVTVRGVFVADSAYSKILVGNFFDDSNTMVIDCNDLENFSQSYYYIDDVCVSTDSAYCWDYNFTCSTNTSTDITNNYSIDIFPNPAENYFHIEIDKTTYKKKPKIEIYTALGKLVHKQQLNEINTKINTTGLKSGLYFVKIYCSNCNSVKKLIIK